MSRISRKILIATNNYTLRRRKNLSEEELCNAKIFRKVWFRNQKWEEILKIYRSISKIHEVLRRKVFAILHAKIEFM